MASAQLRPIPFAIPFDIRPRTEDNADAVNLQKQDGPSHIGQPPLSQAAGQASTVFVEEHAQEGDASVLNQLQTQIEATESGQQRTARQRLDFVSPPETPGTVRTSVHAGVPDGSLRSSNAVESIKDGPAACESSNSAAPVSELKACASGGDATPPAAQAGMIDSQTEVEGACSINISGSSTEAQPRLEGAEQETAESPPPHGEAASGADILKIMKTDSPAGDARAQGSTQAVPGEHTQSASESTAMPAIAAGAGTGAISEPLHGPDGGVQGDLGATIPSATQGALHAHAQSKEGDAATHHPPVAAEIRKPSSTAEAEATQPGKCLSGSFPSPGLIGQQSSYSPKSDEAVHLNGGQAASHAAAQSSDTAMQTTDTFEQTPKERRSEEQRGTAASASEDAPLPGLIAPPSSTPEVNRQQTIDSEVGARGGHATLQTACEEPTESETPLPQQLPAERSINTAQQFSLPVPPPVPLFKRQHFNTNSDAAMPESPLPTALSATSASGASSALEEQLPIAGAEGPAEAETLVGGGSPVRESHVTDADLLALAEEVRRLEQQVAAAQGAVEKACAQADAAHADARSARAEAEEWREREADARSELAAIREAYTEVRGEAEAAKEELQQLHDSYRALQEQMATSLQQAHAVESDKMSMRLEKAQRAIEQERATVRDLQRALAATRQASPAASPRKDGGQARVALAAAQKELTDTRAALEAQKLTNSGLQIRVTELLRAAKETEELRRTYEDLSSRSEAIQRREAHTMELEAAVETLRAQNNALHVTMERLLGTNSELGNKVNSQAARISSLEAAVAEARASHPAPPSASEPAGGVRFSDTELELLALAEYVKELEAALQKQRALSSSHQQSTPAVPASGPAEAVGGRTASDASEAERAPSSQHVHTAIPKPEGPADGKPTPAKVAEPQSPAQPRRQRVTWWNYITGADRATPVKNAS